jgi:hypothetical protein
MLRVITPSSQALQQRVSESLRRKDKHRLGERNHSVQLWADAKAHLVDIRRKVTAGTHGHGALLCNNIR